LRNLSDDYSDYAFTPIIDLNSGRFYSEEYPDDYDTLISIENLQVAGNFNYTLKGDNADNILTAGAGNDTLVGGFGNDTLYGGSGNDTLDGDNGDDIISGGMGDDYLTAGDGNDSLFGGDGDDALHDDWGGNDHFDGGEGTDSLFLPTKSSGASIDVQAGTVKSYFNPPQWSETPAQDEVDTFVSIEIFGGTAYNDTFVGSDGDETFYGFDGNDTLYGGSGNDTLSGGAGDDRLTGGRGNDMVLGGAGDDTIIAVGGSDTFDGGEGSDTLLEDNTGLEEFSVDLYFDLSTGKHGVVGKETGIDEIISVENYTIEEAFNVTLTGDENANRFTANAGDDVLYGFGGNDTLDGGAGNDTLDGGAGNDTMYGGAGDDTYVFEFQGNDTVIDSSGNDIVAADTKGDNGELRFRQLYQSNDQLVLEGSRENTDSKISMSGVESIKWGVIDGGYTMTLGVSGETSDVTNSMYVGTLSDDTLITGQGAYVEGYGADGDDTITVLGGSSWVTGDGGNDTLIGGEGNDTLKGDYTSGDAGHDTLYGNGGNDTLSGNAGNDTLTGGSGSDTFQFHGVFEHDTITDYDSDEDILEFYANDGSALNISDLIETVNSDGNRVLSTADGLSSVTLEGSAGITPVPGGLAMSVVSQDGDVVTFGIFADPITDPDEDGIGSFDFTLNHDALDMQIDAGSLVFATGLSGLQNYDADSGTLTAGAFTLNNVEDLDAPLLTFEATMLDTKAPISIQITDIVVDGDDFASTTEVFDFSALAITTTITDRFGNAMTSAEAQAYEASVNEITATSTTDNVTVFETASGSDLLIDAAMAIDTASDKAIGAFDALQALRLAVGLDKSDGSSEWHDYIAADINKDGRVGADDALNILKFAVGLTDGPSADWVFVDGDADYSAIDRKNTDYDEGVLISDVVTDLSINMTGILVGDVDGSYIA
jgi:Ca2+-binding RTX toxin-like protein